jgi:ADP-ribose pyrophosphatase YjhB (NUDIX family)
MIYRLARPLLARFWLVKRGLTMGVRGIIINNNGQVLLIRHTYTPGWTFPGGGVEIGETAEEALGRELAEEANVAINGRPELHGVFHQPQFSSRDHVFVYVVRDFTWTGPPKPNHEIAECKFFPVDALPPDMSAGARRRLAEVLDGSAPDRHW